MNVNNLNKSDFREAEWMFWKCEICDFIGFKDDKMYLLKEPYTEGSEFVAYVCLCPECYNSHIVEQSVPDEVYK